MHDNKDRRLDKLFSYGIRFPVMQAGMPGIANVSLASRVAQAGGIGTLGLQDVSVWEQNLKATKLAAEGYPISANLLLPYTRKQHVEAVLRQQIPIVTLFWGEDAKLVRQLRDHNVFVFQQVGSADEARAALDAGVDAIIAQGREAGGHIRGTQQLDELIPEIVACAPEVPVFAAGGVYSSADVQRVLALGACGVTTGTRFLLTEESNAHSAYKQYLLDADRTIITSLFGLGWSVPHRVAVNEACNKWCQANGKIPAWLQVINSSMGFTRKILPLKAEGARMQRVSVPLFSSAAHEAQLPASSVESTALYAGEYVGKISGIMSAEAVVQELARALPDKFKNINRPE